MRIGAFTCLTGLVFLLLSCGTEEPPRQMRTFELPDLGGIEAEVVKAVSEAHGKLSPGNLASLRRYGKVLLVHRFAQEAFEVFDEAASLSNDAFEDVYLRARSAFQYDYERALVDFELARKLNPDYTAAHLFCGVVYGQLGRNDKALDAYSRANAVRETRHGLVGVARCLIADPTPENLRKAKRALDRAREIELGARAIYEVSGQIARIEGRTKEADWYERLAGGEEKEFGFFDPLMQQVSLLGRSRVALEKQVEGLINIGDFPAALDRADELVRIAPEAESGRRLRAAVLLRMSRFAEVVEIVEDLMREDPDSQDLLVLEANAWAGLERMQEVFETLTRSLAIDDRHVPTRYLYGFFLGPQDPVSAIRHLEFVLDRSPRVYAHVRLLLGRLYDVVGRRAEARSILREALRWNPADADARRMLGELAG